MKQIIYLGGKKAREYDGVKEPASSIGYMVELKHYKDHISTLPVVDVIGDCDWKEGEVKTEGVDYTTHKIYQQSWDESRPVIVPIPKKQEGEEWRVRFISAFENGVFDTLDNKGINHHKIAMWFEEGYTITRKS